MKPKLLILFCGGTMIMSTNEKGSLVPMEKNKALEAVFNLEPRLKEIADIDIAFIANIDSTNMTPDLWDKIAETIYENYNKYDGFVITHGTDTMAYTASALSFALQDLGKPVVITGAQIPGYRLETDARRNLIHAIQLATKDIAGVFLVFAQQVILGARASKVSHLKIDAFASVNVPKIGEMGVYLDLDPKIKKRKEGLPNLKTGFDTKIITVSIAPGMHGHMLENILNSDVTGIVLIAYGSGNIPEWYMAFLEKARDRDLPIVIHTQCLEGSTKMGLYESGRKALSYSVIEAYDMSLESTITKLMWALKHKTSYEDVKKIMHTNFVGEIHIE